MLALAALVVANVGTLCAEFAGVAAAAELGGVSRYVPVPLAAGAVGLLVLRGSFRRVEHMLLALSAVFVAYVVSGLLAHPNWGAAATGLTLPSLPFTRDALYIAVATVGTTLAPWGLAFIQSYAVNERLRAEDLHYERVDIVSRPIGSERPRADQQTRHAANCGHSASPYVGVRMPAGAQPTSLRGTMRASRTAAVDLYWIPLGAGGRSVRFNGRVFEALEAARQHRQRCDLYHAALVVELDGVRYTIEVAPSPDADEASRGVVATGAVGSRYAGWLRLFRYEVRCWCGGSIPDLGEAVGAPRRLTSDPRIARRLLDLVTTVPTPVWGRDELQAGEMWNSNSMIAWLIASTGLSTELLRPPLRGRAPGWNAGLEVARRSSRYGAEDVRACGPRRPPVTSHRRP